MFPPTGRLPGTIWVLKFLRKLCPPTGGGELHSGLPVSIIVNSVGVEYIPHERFGWPTFTPARPLNMWSHRAEDHKRSTETIRVWKAGFLLREAIS